MFRISELIEVKLVYFLYICDKKLHVLCLQLDHELHTMGAWLHHTMGHVHQGSQEPGIQALPTPLRGTMTLMDTLWMRHHLLLLIILVSCHVVFLWVCITVVPILHYRETQICIFWICRPFSDHKCVLIPFFIRFYHCSQEELFIGGDALFSFLPFLCCGWNSYSFSVYTWADTDKVLLSLSKSFRSLNSDLFFHFSLETTHPLLFCIIK